MPKPKTIYSAPTSAVPVSGLNAGGSTRRHSLFRTQLGNCAPISDPSP